MATGRGIAFPPAVVQNVGPLSLLDLRSAERGLIDAPQMADGAAGVVAGGVVDEARRAHPCDLRVMRRSLSSMM